MYMYSISMALRNRVYRSLRFHALPSLPIKVVLEPRRLKPSPRMMPQPRPVRSIASIPITCTSPHPASSRNTPQAVPSPSSSEPDRLASAIDGAKEGSEVEASISGDS